MIGWCVWSFYSHAIFFGTWIHRCNQFMFTFFFQAPDDAYYIPNFITEEEECYILRQVSTDV